MSLNVRASLVLIMLAIGAVQYAESRKLLKLAAAAAIIRGGPIIPIPIRYPVHVPHPKIVKVPVKVPEHHHTHSVHKVVVPVHTHSVSEKHVPVHSHAHLEKAVALPVGHGHGHESFGDYGGHGLELGGFDGGHGHNEIGHIADTSFGGHSW
ncbi:uncharacterized protein LOC111259889 [Varroa jacobsoni]|uniref:uncharacterized protein LOC111259889 n=1 Tax=Varroa jacobsoni TaxID=62625 RepID=UPI000BF9082E|nr:uncharacterized protein LOC111259889 [Varroa jacobsoni]